MSKITLESGYQYLNNEASLDILIFMKKFLLDFYANCQILKNLKQYLVFQMKKVLFTFLQSYYILHLSHHLFLIFCLSVSFPLIADSADLRQFVPLSSEYPRHCANDLLNILPKETKIFPNLSEVLEPVIIRLFCSGKRI